MSSSHSRSSSEILSLQYIDILPRFFDAFKKDFDFDDVKHYVKDLFTKEEYQSIMSEADELRRLVRLFTVLCSRELVASQFVKKIKPDYDFLCEAIKRELESPCKNTTNYVELVHLWRSNHSKHTDFNVLRMEPHLRLRDALRKLKRCHSIVLEGELGMGKKWIALNACYDYAVMEAMDFQIFWLDVSDCNSPEQDLSCLQTLRLMLGGVSASHSPTFSSSSNNNGGNLIYQECKYNESISNRKLELQQLIRKKLSMPEHRKCLLILKDVQNIKTVTTFNLGFKLLIITRNKKVSESLSSKMSTHMSIENGFTKAEFYTLFEKYLNQTHDKFPKNANDIYEYSQGHPYLLSIIAQNIRQKKSNWDEWIRNLQNLEITDNKFTKVVEISLNVLSPELLELYAIFGIFPHSVPIPVKLLAALWNKSLHDADEIVQRFHTYSFVNKQPCNPVREGSDDDVEFCCCVLPFIYSSHLRASKAMQALINSQELHGKVIDYYKIEQAFCQRTEIELCNSQHDWYFFTFIGYHLKAADDREKLFPLIYLDFGFLDQKMRAVGLSNTISDLRSYENEITNCDNRKRDLLAALLEFLPKVEEKLTESEDTSLLQYALMASGFVYLEAKAQIRQFKHRVWFSERGNFHKRRQIVNLPNQAKFLRFLNQDLCLIVLSNNNMLLLDISLECNTKPVLLENDEEKSATIIEARLFRDDQFILTLDTAGVLKVWSIADYFARSIVIRRSSRQKVHVHNFKTDHHKNSKRPKQRITENSMGQHGFISAFYIEQKPPEYKNETYLHIAFSNGEICLYKWNSDPRSEEFVAEKVPILQTNSNDIRFLCKLLNTYYMLLSKSGDISFWNLRDSSKSFVPFKWPKAIAGPVSYELYYLARDTLVIIVFADKVISLAFDHKNFTTQPNATVREIYVNRSDSIKSSITCAKLSSDQRYLVLGTRRGLIVYDVNAESELLRSNVSESISCVDVFPLDDRIFKYVIICGSEHRKSLNIFAVRTNEDQSITWAHNVTSIGNEASSDPQLEPDVWLLGQKLYDMYYKEDGSSQLVAVDSKYRVHQVNTTNKKSWSIIMPRETSEAITAITTGNKFAFVGYRNGDIFNISKDIFETDSMKAPITYLQIFDDAYLVASTAMMTSIRTVNTAESANSKIEKYEFNTKKCFKVFDQYLLLINEQGTSLLLDLNSTAFNIIYSINGLQQSYCDKLCCCDYQNDHLILASETFITLFKFMRDNATTEPRAFFIDSQSINTTDMPKNSISAVALTHDAGLIAIGFTSGDIEIHKMRDSGIDYFYRLQSHCKRINDIKFSIGNEVLVSCAEQLCFWSVPYLLNNPLTINTPKRRSSRFSSQRSSDVEEVDAMPCRIGDSCKNGNFLNVQTTSQNGNGNLTLALHNMQLEETIRAATAKAWCDKRGPAEKPELLSCIKFDGNKAEKLFTNPDFTQFNIIDDEGVYYHLALLNVDDEIASAVDEILLSNTIGPENIDYIDIDGDFSSTSWRVSIGTDDNSIGEDDVYA